MADAFNIGISALVTAQRQLSTTGHNIANVNTEGFSRQRAELYQRPAQITGGLFIGSGVKVEEVSRVADSFLINQLQSANTNVAKASTFLDFSSRIDNLMGDGTFSTSLQNFFGAVQDANGDPDSIAAREVLLSSAKSLAARFSDMEQQLTSTARDLNGEIEARVDDINSLANAIADINGDIVQAIGSSQGEQPNDLLDQRDRLVAELSELVGVSTVEQKNGAMNVFIGSGQLLVANTSSLPLSTIPNPLDGTRLEVTTNVGGAASVISSLITNGELGAVLEFRDEVLDPTRNAMGRLAVALSVTFNEQHREGLDLNDEFGTDVFSIGSPQVNGATTNAGTVNVALDPGNLGALTTADYRLTYDGTDFTLLNLTSGSTQTLSGAGPFSVDGLTIDITSAPAAGDQYLIQPTKTIARNMSVLISDVRDFALARPNRTTEALTNIGDGTIGDPSVLDITDPNLLVPVDIVFNDPPTTFQIGGAGPLIPYADGGNIDLNGWRVQIAGSPEAGDVFTVAPNFGGVGDNGNGLLLADLQLAEIVDGQTATYQEAFSQIVGSVGAKTQQAQFSRDALQVLQENAKASRDALSAVNLDEEAAQLLRFQQAYSAAAEVISAANSTFDSLLAAVRG